MKSDEMLNIIDTIAKNTLGRTLTEAWKENICIFCGESITGFRDALSEKEYHISGLCQKCQDETFGAD